MKSKIPGIFDEPMEIIEWEKVVHKFQKFLPSNWILIAFSKRFLIYPYKWLAFFIQLLAQTSTPCSHNFTPSLLVMSLWLGWSPTSETWVNVSQIHFLVSTPTTATSIQAPFISRQNCLLETLSPVSSLSNQLFSFATVSTQDGTHYTVQLKHLS